jgi:hypothetical protein
MKYAFQKMQLEAKGFYDLIGTWAEMQLIVTDDSAVIVGDGYTSEIEEALTILVLDWEATIPLSGAGLELPAGSYDLNRKGDMVHASQGQTSYPLPDRPVVVAVRAEPDN